MQDETTQTELNLQPPRPKRAPIVLALLALLLALLCLAGLGYAWLTLKQQRVTLNTTLQNLQQTTSDNSRSLQQQQQLLTMTQLRLEQVIKLSQRDNKKWAMAEVDYLLHLADLNLRFENNIPLAIELLTLADQKLKNLADPSGFTLRQALANNIAALNAVPAVDVPGLIMQLNAISAQVAQLPIVPSQITTHEQIPVAQTSAQKDKVFWQRLWSNVKDSLKNIIIIRTQKTDAMPLLTLKQQGYLIENIRLQLAQAQWAVLHRQPVIYQQSLQQASQWVNRYFMQNSMTTRSVLQALKNLQAINIKPSLPDLAPTLKLVQPPTNNQTAPPASSFTPSQRPLAS